LELFWSLLDMISHHIQDGLIALSDMGWSVSSMERYAESLQ